MKGLGILIVSIILGAVITLAVSDYQSRPEISYRLEASSKIYLLQDRIGDISAKAKNIGDTSVTAILNLKSDNVTFVAEDAKPYMQIVDREVFYYKFLEKNMETYSTATFHFYIGENVNGFSIEISIDIEKTDSIFNFSRFTALYPTKVEYIQTEPNVFSLKE